jgi:hypothetical protein
MKTKIHGWERTKTDSILVQQFIRAFFQCDTDRLGDLVSERCIVHWSAGDGDELGPEAVFEIAREVCSSDQIRLESVHTTTSSDQIVAAVTTSGQHGTPVVPDAETEATDDSGQTTFANLKLENGKIVEFWLHVEGFTHEADRTLNSVIGRVAAWLDAG